MFNADNELLRWVHERENVRRKKEDNQSKPWTDDLIIQNYRFCNVKREDDTVTRWIFNNWLYPNKNHPNIAFAICMARHFNWPETLEEIGFPYEWDPERVRDILNRRKESKKKIYTNAYTISTGGESCVKLDYSIDRVLSPLWESLRLPHEGETLESYWSYLQSKTGFASFMAGQVVADLKFIDPLIDAPDWNNWAPLGPGSIRGLNRFFGRKLTKTLRQSQGIDELQTIKKLIKEKLNLDLALHNVQNCMCEFDKYIRLKYENGHVRSKYNGAC